MTKKPSKLGFSLIELSIVIVVIAVFVLAVTKGSRILEQTRLKSGKALTNSSPVNSIEDLTLWLETTSDKSFDSGVGNNSTVATWYNINSQSNDTIDVVQTTSARRPTYLSSGINFMPALQFSGSNVYMNINGPVINDIKGYTIIMVTYGTSSGGPMYGNQVGNSGVTLIYNGSTSINVTHAGDLGGGASYSSYTIPTFAEKPVIFIITSSNPTGAHCGGGDAINIYTDGTLRASGTLCAYSRNKTHALGYKQSMGATTYNGKIGEVIIFSRALKKFERESIEQYLSAKWRIPLS